MSDKELKILREAKREMERRGYGSLEEFLDEEVLREIEGEDEADLGDLIAGFALGAIAALGAAALIKLLSEQGKGAQK